MRKEEIISENFWNDIHKSYNRNDIVYDDWLDAYTDIIKKCEGNILDLGCGNGNDTLYFIEKGKNVYVCDQSENAINNIKKNFPEVKEAKCFNMLDGIDFLDETFEIVCADLSLHYFREEDTKKILEEIDRILLPNGHIFVRVNSMKDTNYGAGSGEEIEHHLFLTDDGMLKRFFDEKDINRIFSSYNIEKCEEVTMNRYGSEKRMYSICLLKK